MGNEVLVIIVPPWNRRDVYQFDEKVLIRKGTNVFAAKPEESKLMGWLKLDCQFGTQRK
jgi:hypothetical protein